MSRTGGRQRGSLVLAVALLALLLGQALALVHDPLDDHAGEASCHLCLGVHTLGAGAAPVLPGVPALAGHPHPPPAPRAAIGPARAPSPWQARAPPDHA